MTVSPFIRQLLVAGSPQLAALSIGGAVTYPGVLLQQLSSNDSSFHLDLDTASWIGSIHGLAGIPSILMPTFMQWRGRKAAFITACLFSITGWILAFTATNSTAILISESFHGFGSDSVMAVSMLSMSEMLSPQLRNVSMVSYCLVQTLGMALMGILGRYLHWKTVSLIMCSPIAVAMVICCTWPESPSWLAYKGKFDKCERAFTWLRGTSELTRRELQELIMAQRENLVCNKRNKQSLLKYIWLTLTSRDFYIPSLHIFVLLDLTYWSGSMVILIYSMEMVKRATHNDNAVFYGTIIMNTILFICATISAVLVRCFNNKTVLLFSTFCTTACLLGSSAVNYAQTAGLISKDSLICLYFLIAYMIAISLGVFSTVYPIAAELMPVKHRGIGGSLYVICGCILHASSLKSAPYLFLYINLWGTLLIFALNATICGLFLWRYLPETKGRTLQEIEEYYTFGRFKKRDMNIDHNNLNS